MINYGGSPIDRGGYWPRWMRAYDTLWGILAKGGSPSLSIADPNKKIMKFKKKKKKKKKNLVEFDRRFVWLTAGKRGPEGV